MALNAVCVFTLALTGTIFLEQKDPSKAVTRVHGEFRQLEAGEHGFHIHEFGDTRNNCMNAGTHFNPFKKNHGAPTDEDRHVGDMGNINVGADGVAKIDHEFGQIDLHGVNSVIGRAIVVHKLQDDLGKGGNDESKKTGNAGARLDCCVIGWIKSD